MLQRQQIQFISEAVVTYLPEASKTLCVEMTVVKEKRSVYSQAYFFDCLTNNAELTQ
jgi:hypothetical protein